jgi:tetratricopeptide (TPR) repeat protein
MIKNELLTVLTGLAFFTLSFVNAHTTLTTSSAYLPGPTDSKSKKVSEKKMVNDRDIFSDLVRKGDDAFTLKQWSGALQFYRGAEAIDPFNKDLRKKIATCRYEIRQTGVDPDAMEQQEVTDQRERLIQQFLSSGDNALKSGDKSKALSFYKEALSMQPNDKDIQQKVDICVN